MIGFGWMGQVHAARLDRACIALPRRAVRARLVAVADTAAGDRTRPARVRRTGSNDVLRGLARADRPRRHRRRVGVRTQLRPPRRGGRRRRGGQAPVDREARRSRRDGDRRDRRGRRGRRVSSRPPASTTATRRRSSRHGSWSPSGRLGRHRSTSRCASSPTTPRTPKVRSPGASSTSTPAAVCSATWSATPPTSPATWPATSPRWSSTTARFITERPRPRGPARTSPAGSREPSEPVENEDYVARAAAFRVRVARARSSREPRLRSASSARYGIAVHGDRGALAWDFRRMGELRVCLDQDYQDASYTTVLVEPRPRGVRGLPAGVAASPWATTTSR